VRYFYNVQLIETTQDAKVFFYRAQFSCHNAKVVLADRGDSGEVLIGQSPGHRHTFPIGVGSGVVDEDAARLGGGNRLGEFRDVGDIEGQGIGARPASPNR
jgi:hypothetical protein